MSVRGQSNTRRSSATFAEFLVAVLFGVVIGLLVSYFVVLSLALVVGALALALIGLAQRNEIAERRSRRASSSGPAASSSMARSPQSQRAWMIAPGTGTRGRSRSSP